MKIALVDLDEDSKGCNNKDQTGTYGSVMNASGLIGRVFHALKRKRLRLPIISFGYLAAILRNQGHEVNIYSSFPEDEEIVIIATSIIGYRQEIAFARKVKSRHPCKVGFTGAFAKAKPDLFLEEDSFVIDGEPENWALNFNGVDNLEGVVRSERVTDLDSLPFPDWHGFPLWKYEYYPLLKGGQFLTMQTSRGCPFACSYCQYTPLQGKQLRKRSPENVVEEIYYLKKEFSAKNLLFRDIVFSIDINRVRKIAETIITKGLKIAWGCETRADCLTKELLKLFKESGMRFINLGIESPDIETLRSEGRQPIKHGHLVEIINYCENIDIRVNGFYMIGFPNDTEEKIRQTVRYACKLNTSLAQFCVVTPYPGTDYFEAMKNDARILTTDWSQFTTYNPVMRLDNLSPDDVLRLKQYAYNKYFLRPSWFFSRGWKLLLKN